jgi:hypothetical protein
MVLRRNMKAIRPVVLARDSYRCCLCGVNTNRLTAHHILPIWARQDLRDDLDNLATLCKPCHLKVNGHELQYAPRFGVTPEVVQAAQHMTMPRGKRTLAPAFRRIVRLTYLGKQDTYDLEMEGPHHNFVANGIVTHNSQLSQRYVDESETDFVEPDIIAELPELHTLWMEAITAAHRAYIALADTLAEHLKTTMPEATRTARRKAARQAARSVLPNATETKILVTANARALRHFIELRGSEHAEPEIRKLAIAILRLMLIEAPNMFGDFVIETLPDGNVVAITPHSKV